MANLQRIVVSERLKLQLRVKSRAVGISFVCLSLSLLLGGSGSLAATHDHPEPVVLAPGYTALEFTPPLAGSYDLPPFGPAADGPVLDAIGQPRRIHDYLGDKVVVLSFIYTTCNDVNGCPLATFVFKGVQDSVLNDPALSDEVRLLSFSFDPAHDTPEALNTYADHFRATGFDWQFLTTSSTAMLDPTLQAYGQSVIRDYDAEGQYLGSMSHILRVFLIDKQKRIRNIYSTSYLHADTVANDIRTLLAETPAS
jgi:cytochrome c peroxidase